MKTLPVYEAFVSPEEDGELVVDCVSLVDKPAIGKLFMAFSEAVSCKFSTVDEEQRIIIGPAMIPDQLIYRNNKLGEHNVFFSKATIKTIAEKFFQNGFNKGTNIMHSETEEVADVVFFQSFIRDTDKGLVGIEGDYPEGTWFLGAKVNDDTTWGKVKDGTIKGFSAEGLFGYKKVEETEEEKLASVIELLDKDSEEAFKLLGELLNS